jgi:hypothetical protein
MDTSAAGGDDWGTGSPASDSGWPLNKERLQIERFEALAKSQCSNQEFGVVVERMGT